MPGAARGAGELLRVRLLPAVDDAHAVGAELAPVALPAVLAEACHRGEQEREPGTGGGRVLDDEQVPVARIGELLERRRRGDATLGERRAVVVEADLAVVDRRDAVVGRHVVVADRVELLRAVLVEQIAVERTREQVVVHAEEHVALRVAGGEQCAVERLARVSGLQDPQLQAALPLERRLDVLRDRERLMGDEHDVRRCRSPPPHPVAPSASAATSVPSTTLW